MNALRGIIIFLWVIWSSADIYGQCIAQEQNVTGISVCEGSSGNLSSTGCTPNTCNLPCQFNPANCIVTVTFTGTHTYVSDLHQWYLIGPNGCGTLQLHQHLGTGVCNSGDNFTNLTFTNGASSGPLNICGPGTPYTLTGTWAISGSLNSIAGCDINAPGWAVQVFDCIGADVGFLTNVQISFNCPGCNSGIPVEYAVSGNAVINDNSCSPATAATLIVPPTVTPQVNWYNTAVGGASLGMGNTFNPGPMAPGEYTFYANCECPTLNEYCGNARTPVTYTVHDVPEILNTTAECESGTVTITVEASPISSIPAGCVWQYSFDGGATWSDNNIATGIPPGGPPRQIRVRNSCSTNCMSPNVAVPIPPDCILCPDLSAPPPDVSLIDSDCSIFCNLEGGLFIPQVPSCPPGSTLMFFPDLTSTSGGNAAVPAYDQENSMTIYYRCVCEQDLTTVSPVNTTTTEPGMCFPPVVSFDISAPAIVCAGDIVLVTFTGTAEAGAEFIWNFDGGTATLFNSEGPHEVFWDTGGTKTITLSVTQNGCTETFEMPIDITEPPSAIITLLNLPCPGQNILLGGSTFPFNLNVQYEWQGPNGYNSNQQNPVDATEAGTYTLTVYLNGCPSNTESIEVTFAPEPDIQIQTAGLTVCEGQSVSISATGAASFTWYNLNTGQVAGNGSNINPIITETTTFQVVGLSLDGCEGMAEITIDVNPSPTPEITYDGLLCLNSEIELTASGADAFMWQDDPTNTSATRIISIGQPGTNTYTVIATDNSTGCTGTASVSITLDPLPPANINPTNPIMCQGESLILNATGGTAYQWDQGLGSDPTIQVTPDETTTYTVTVTDSNGCEAEASSTVSVTPQIDAPEVFCGPTTGTSITFEWNPVPGATNMSVTTLSGHTGQINGNSIVFDNLVNGESVTIRVTAESVFPCPPTETELTCTSTPCPDISLAISPVDNICLDQNTGPMTLEVAVSGGNPNLGIYEWVGPGITDAENGIFDPGLAGAGQHMITIIYNEELCFYSEIININVYQVPGSTFTISDSPICADSTTVVTYTGNASATAQFTWNFDSGNASPGSGAGPHSVYWSGAGTKTISLSISDNGCVSNASTQQVVVDQPLSAPVITCGNATTTSVEFMWTAVTGATGYNVIVLSGQTGTLSGTSFLVENLMPEEVVSIQLEVFSNSSCPNQLYQWDCAAASCPNFTLDIAPVPNICLNSSTAVIPITTTITGHTPGAGTISFTGTGIAQSDLGEFDPQVAGPGLHIITVTYQEGPCSIAATLPIQIYSTPIASFSLDKDTVCVMSPVIVNTLSIHDAMQFTWDFDNGIANPGNGPGPQTVSWNNAGTKNIDLVLTENGCSSPVFSLPVIVNNPIAAPLITCSTNTESVTFNWNNIPGATGFDAVIINGSGGILTGNSYAFTGLMPGDAITIEVTALTNNPCGPVSSELTCVAQDCPDVVLDFTELDPICLTSSTGTITLEAVATPQDPSGVLSWTGFGITNAGTGTFDPKIPGAGVHTIDYRYTVGNCSYTGSGDITIFDTPTASFTASSPICIDGSTNIVYTGSASPGAGYTWTYDNGTAIPGNGAGPHTVTWNTAGMKNISLQVAENGCTSILRNESVTVVPLLEEPVITCQTNTSSITFNWINNPNATGQIVTLLNGQPGIQIGNSYSITGLVPGNSATIQVEFISGGPCPNTISELTCTAQDCPDVEVVIESINPICLSSQSPEIQLNATASPDDGNGIFIWSGTGISNPASGIFDPKISGTGSHTIDLIYEVGNCQYPASIILEVNPTPDPTFTIESPVCTNQDAILSYIGLSPAASFNWNFNGGTPDNTTAQIPASISWSSSGQKNVQLEISENGCVANSTVPVDVIAPLVTPSIQCNGSLTSVSFDWADIAGSSGYIISIDGGPADTIYMSNYTVEPVATGTSVSIQVIAIGTEPCGDSQSANSTCVAMNCPTVNVQIAPVTPMCLTSDTPDMTLSVQITPGSGNGNFMWSGPGIIQQSSGLFSAKSAGPGIHKIRLAYSETSCNYYDSIEIQVGLIPDFELSAISPSCFGFKNGSIELESISGGTSPVEYSFNSGAFGSNTLFSNLGAGNYTVTARDALGCMASRQISLTQPPRITLDLGGGLSVVQGSDVDITASSTIPFDSIQSYLWMVNNADYDCPLCSLITVHVDERTSVSLQIMDNNGCTAEDQIMIDILKQYNVFVPTGFTPNGDGINDTFTIHGAENIKEVKSMEIFDRWGEKVFTQSNFPPNQRDYGWNGQHHQRELMPALFTYSIVVEFTDGVIKRLHGEVNLIR